MAANLQQLADGSLNFLDEGTGFTLLRVGGPTVRVGGANATNTNVPNYRGLFHLVARIQGPTDTGGGIAGLANPFGQTVYCLAGGALIVTTQSAGACTVAFGIAANATTSAANLLAATSVAATGITPTTLATSWTSTQFFTASTSTGASSGLVGVFSIPILIP